MENSTSKNELSARINELIQKLEEVSENEIKQKHIARALGVSEPTLTKAKSSYYNMPLNTLTSIKDNLELLFNEYNKSPDITLAALRSDNKLDKYTLLFKKNRFNLLLIILVLAIIFLGKYCCNIAKFSRQLNINPGEQFDQYLTYEYLDSLLGIEWFIADPDSVALEKFKDSKYLKIGTEIGDYYRRFGEGNYRKEIIKNLFYRKINCGDCCTITLKLSDFHPYQEFQQAGFLLFYSDTINRRFYTRLTYTFEGNQPPSGKKTQVLPIFYDYYSKEFALNRGGRHLTPISLPKRYDESLKTDSITLQIGIRDGVYAFSYMRNTIRGLTLTKGFDLNLPPPKIIGIGAWQGHSIEHDLDDPLADVIPVTFKRLIIEPCSD